MAIGQRQRYRHLAIVLLAELTAILPRHADRMPSLLGKARVVDDPGRDRAVPLNLRQHHLAHLGQYPLVQPTAQADKMQQRLMLGRHPRRSRHRRQRFDALAFARHHQAHAIVPQWTLSISVADYTHKPLDIRVKPRSTVISQVHLSPHAGSESPPLCDSPPHGPRLCNSVKLEHRIADPRILHLIQKWLKAGILEDGVVTVSEKGTGQGSVISPLLANAYLHYSFDLWAERWRRREATGDMIMVRYADDIVVGFEHETDARRYWDEMRDRLQEFALSLHPKKTRLIEFGRHAANNRKQCGLGKPETFNFLGMTFLCGKSRGGKFLLKRRTRRDRMQAKIKEVAGELRRRMHQSIPEQGKWLKQVITGFFNYHAVPTNWAALGAFRAEITERWRRTLSRRSQRGDLTWARMAKLADDWLPKPRILHPWPNQRFAVRHLR